MRHHNESTRLRSDRPRAHRSLPNSPFAFSFRGTRRMDRQPFQYSLQSSPHTWYHRNVSAAQKRRGANFLPIGFPPVKKSNLTRRSNANNYIRQKRPQQYRQRRQGPAVYGHPRYDAHRRFGGDFYRPSRDDLRNCKLESAVVFQPDSLKPTATSPPAGSDSSAPAASTETVHILTEEEMDAALDEAFAELELEEAAQAAEGDESEEEEEEEDYDAPDYQTPPLSQWQYPDEPYEEDRRIARELGCWSVERTFIGAKLPRRILDGLDELA